MRHVINGLTGLDLKWHVLLKKIFQLCRAVSQPVKKTDTKTDSKEQTMSRKNLPESKKDRLLKKTTVLTSD